VLGQVDQPKGSVGPVTRWQRYLVHQGPIYVERLGSPPDDGAHGRSTEAATAAWLATQGLERDGKGGTRPIPPSPYSRLTAAKTPVGALDVYAEFKLAAPELSRAALLVLLSQWYGETGAGKSTWCFNMGNFKSKPGALTSDWCFFACNELLSPAQAAQSLKSAPPRDALRPDQIAWFKQRTGLALDADGSSAVITGRTADLTIVWFFPPHPYACFAAFKNLRDGAAWYVGKMRTRFASAWPAVVAGDVVAFAEALKRAGYFTDTLAHYTAGLRANYAQLDRTVPR
jgi:hypothetical protein